MGILGLVPQLLNPLNFHPIVEPRRLSHKFLNPLDFDPDC